MILVNISRTEEYYCEKKRKIKQKQVKTNEKPLKGV